MKVIILSPKKILVAGLLSAIMIGASILGSVALIGAFRIEEAEAQNPDPVGARYWYFPEGYTGPGFEEWILIYNPSEYVGGSGYSTPVHIDAYGPAGYIGRYTIGVESGQRVSININDVLLENYGYSGDVTIVAHNMTYPFFAERALYFDYKGQWTGGSQILGYPDGFGYP